MSDWIDITRPMFNGMVQWPTDRPFIWRQVQAISGPGTANVSEVEMSLHTGTHIDAPLHFIADGGDVASIALQRLCGPAVVLDVPAERDITAADLDGAVAGERLLLRTANRRRWEKETFDPDFHALTSDAAEFVVERGVPAIGIDYLSIDRFNSPDSPAHMMLLGAGVPIIESVDLDRVAPGRYEMIALPLKIPGAEGSPARVILRRIVS